MNEHMIVADARRRAQTWAQPEPRLNKPMLTMSELLEADAQQRTQEGILHDALRLPATAEFAVQLMRGMLIGAKVVLKFLGYHE